MARAGRPLNHDPKADGIRQEIMYATPDDAIRSLSSSDVNILDGEGRTPIIFAAREGKMPVAEWLVANGSNINHQDRNGYTALHYAAQRKHREIIELLLKSGAVVNLRDIHGNTPLWYAAFDAQGDYEIVKMLLTHKADPASRNNANRSPLDFAAQRGDKILEGILKES